MKVQFGTKAIFLATVLVALVLVATTSWIRRPVNMHTLDGKKFPTQGIDAIWVCVMQADHQNLSRLLMIDQFDLNRPSSPPEGGWTLLQHAVFRGSVECVEILLENGADPNLAYGGSPTPLELARRKHKQDIIALLKQHGD